VFLWCKLFLHNTIRRPYYLKVKLGHSLSPLDINEMPNGDLVLGGSMGTSPDSLNYTYQAWIMRVNNTLMMIVVMLTSGATFQSSFR
jgi:hypothetical protein